MTDLTQLLLSDFIFLLGIQAVLALFLIYAAFRQWQGGRKTITGRGGVTASVKRGQGSWDTLHLAYGISSILAVQVISASEAFKGWKVALITADLAALIYLYYYNGWFRNKVIGVVNKSRGLEEQF